MAAEYEIVRDLDAVADVHELSCEHCSTVNRAKATIVALAEALNTINLMGGPGFSSEECANIARSALARLKGDSHAG